MDRISDNTVVVLLGALLVAGLMRALMTAGF